MTKYLMCTSTAVDGDARGTIVVVEGKNLSKKAYNLNALQVMA